MSVKFQRKMCWIRKLLCPKRKCVGIDKDDIVEEDVRQRLAILCQSPTLSESATTAVPDKRIKLCSRWSLWAGQTNLVTTPFYTLLKFSSKMKTRIFHKTCVCCDPAQTMQDEKLCKKFFVVSQILQCMTTCLHFPKAPVPSQTDVAVNAGKFPL